ncbi:hypothetical protein B0H17DRAFT_89113 [Mycena rosella]|uniref:DUF6533 domain-containing protein n=1 Tax=Mycena rosella TaxID=1033263 RepID=A0AAD7DZS8_MYCRO|nr:hypothetical protein B0H17DRAFT_89113 [Mycena rosella]
MYHRIRSPSAAHREWFRPQHSIDDDQVSRKAQFTSTSSELRRMPLPLTQTDLDLDKTAIAALVFLVWENLITLDDEVEYIWPKPRTAWVKSVFLFLRYFPLAVQLCNRILDEKVIQQAHLSYSALRAWYISQAVVAYLGMTGVEFVMMVRVYALYHNSRWIGWGLGCVLLAETIAVIAGIFITLPGVHFEPQLLLTKVPHSFAYLGISALVSQAIILGLTLHRFLQGQWAGTSLGNLLIRDGSIVYFIFFGVFRD